MQDDFLFDDDDPKQRGVGCDALCADDKRLKFKWTWHPFGRGKGKVEPGQCSIANLENGWNLEATFWHTNYSVSVDMGSDPVETYRADINDRFAEGPVLVTRLDAQLKAEELFVNLGKDIVRQCES